MPRFERIDDEKFFFSYYGTADFLPAVYVDPTLIDAYFEEEAFLEAVKASYSRIDLSGRNKRDEERFEKKCQKTADWLRKQANGIYF